MKKYFVFLLLILLLTSCSKQAKDDEMFEGSQVDKSQGINTENSDDTQENDLSKEIISDGYSFTFDNIKISLNEEATSILESLGEPIEQFQAPSCAFQGTDIFYLYPGFELSTYPLEDLHYISTIDFIDDSVSTENGLRIGSTLDDVIAKNGNDFKQSGYIYTYELGDSSISFVINKQIVENITYVSLLSN